MSTQTNNFTRSNVNAATLQITDPARSSFNLGHRNELSIPFGKIVPVSTKILLPTDTFSGSLKPNFHLEKIGTPSIGATRLDTHTFVVNFRRINKDLRSSLENGLNLFPSVNIYKLLDNYLGHLVYNTGSSSPYSFSQYIKSILPNYSSFAGVSQTILTNTLSTLQIYIDVYPSDSNQDAYYQLDNFIFLKSYYSNLQSIILSSLETTPDPKLFFQIFLPAFFRPFIGPSSLLDYLGYPCFSQYNKITAVLDSILPSAEKTIYDSFKSQFSSDLLEGFLSNSVNLFYSKAASKYEFDILDHKSQFSELPLRAYYSIWYDYLRNWHIEIRKNILDPDNFNSTLVISDSPNFPSGTIPIINELSKWFSFYMLKPRDYGTDFLTSIQTDDAFRHVYSPVFSQPKEDSPAVININNTNEQFDPSTIIGIENNLFGGDDYNNVNSLTSAAFVQDLQTMRRCGMLEKWLARNYYYPDTYVGRLQARFGVRPSDYEVLVSQYIGGSESFISGQELIANMSTSESVVGSRTLKADVSTIDKFSGSVSDYSILISVVSTVPIVTYDVISPAASITDFIDFPQPEFATDTRVEARVSDFLRGFSIQPFIGYVPRYYMFRVSADESHGRFLTDYRTYNWLRDNYSMSQENFDFSLNPYSLRVNLPLNAFIGLKPWDDFAFGSCDVNLVVNRALPAAIEII